MHCTACKKETKNYTVVILNEITARLCQECSKQLTTKAKYPDYPGDGI